MSLPLIAIVVIFIQMLMHERRSRHK